MSVISMRRRTVPGEHYTRGNEVIPDELTFLAGAAFTLLAPTIVYSAVIEQLWPLYVMGCNEAMGVMLGLAMFKKSSSGFLSCVPVTRVPPVPNGVDPARLREAA